MVNRFQFSYAILFELESVELTVSIEVSLFFSVKPIPATEVQRAD